MKTCWLNLHDWQYVAAWTVTNYMVFSQNSATFTVKRCGDCGVYNIPRGGWPYELQQAVASRESV